MASRQNPFGHYTAGNGEGLSRDQNAGSTFSHGDRFGSLWGQTGTRVMTGPSRATTNEMYASSNSARLGHLPPSADNSDPWAPRVRSDPWKGSETLTTRSGSGSTSPNRTREVAAPRNDFGSTPAQYGHNPRSRIASQAGSGNPRAKPVGDTTSNHFQKSFPADEKENASPFSSAGLDDSSAFRGYARDKRGSQGSEFPEENHSREQSMPRAGRAEVESYQPSSASFGGLPVRFRTFDPEPAQTQRPSLHATASFPMAQTGPYDEEVLARSMRKAITGLETSKHNTSRGQNQISHGQTSQLNADTPSWQADRQSAPRDYATFYQSQQQSNPLTSTLQRDHLSGAAGLGRGTSALPRSSHVLDSAHDVWHRPSPYEPPFPVDAERSIGSASLMGLQSQSPTYTQQFVPVYNVPQYNGYITPQYANVPQLSAMIHANSFPNNPAAHRHDQRGRDSVKTSSPVLDDFKKNTRSNKRFELKDIFGHVVEFCGDQTGSRFVQNKLETANSDDKERLFNEIFPNAVPLMSDLFGNYVIQKFFEHGTQQQKRELAAKMQGRMLQLSLNMYSCRVVQKALEHILADQQAELVRELKPDMRTLIDNQHANHVVQKIVTVVPREHLDFVFDAFHGGLLTLCQSQYACRIVQRILEYGTEDDKATIMTELHPVAKLLVDDQYGNYVVQHIIRKGGADNRHKLVAIVKKDLLKFSKNKHASNVVEACIESCSMAERCEFASEFMGSTETMKGVIKDQYANYVVQKLAKHLDGTARQEFDDFVKSVVGSIKQESARNGGPALQKFIDSMWPPEEKNRKLSSTAQDSPTGLQIDTAAPTPGLTREPNTPLSSGPPSTDASAAEEAVLDVKSVPGTGSTPPQIETDGN